MIAAYNCGPENINKAIRRANNVASLKGPDGEPVPVVKDYWHIYPYLPRETRGYVPAFIAANYMMTYYSLHNICPMTTRLPAKTDTVMVSKNVHLEQVAAVMGLNIDQLRSLNPMYRRDVVPGSTEPQAIRLPLTETGRFIDLEDSIYTYRSGELLNKRLEVQVNDDTPTYYHKSKRYSRGKKRAAVRRKSATARRKGTARKRRPAARRRRR